MWQIPNIAADIIQLYDKYLRLCDCCVRQEIQNYTVSYIIGNEVQKKINDMTDNIRGAQPPYFRVRRPPVNGNSPIPSKGFERYFCGTVRAGLPTARNYPCPPFDGCRRSSQNFGMGVSLLGILGKR
jgi:hypothetical protein